MSLFISTTRRVLLGAVAATAVGLTAGAASAEFPEKPIEVVIHAKYGGGTDTTARMMMIRSRRELGGDMVVVAKRGGGGAAAQSYANEKPRDGYTMLALTQTHLYTIARGKSALKIDDLVGVARAMDDPTFITVRKDSPFKTIEDLIAASKKGALNWGVAEIGSTEHIGLARFAKAAGIPYKAVPFGSGAQMVQALLAGTIDATLPNVSEAVGQISEGSLRPLVVLGDKRLGGYPDVPTAKEKGIDIRVTTTRGYAVLKGTPQPVIDKLSAALVKAMKHGTFANYLAGSGLSAEESVVGSEEWTKNIREEFSAAEEALNELGFKKK